MKYLAHLLLIPLVWLALTPPMHFQLDCTVNTTMWLWAIFTSGFLAFLYLNFKVNVALKLFLIWCFTSCFFSRAPYISFTMYWTVTVCAYYYLACTKIQDFTPVKKSIQAIFFFITLLIIMQLFGLDSLLNFGQGSGGKILGVIGNKMMLASFVCVLAPFLIHKPLNWIPIALIAFISGSSGMLLSIALGGGYLLFRKFKKLRVWIVILALAVPLLFAHRTGDFKAFTLAGRGPVWLKTAQLIKARPQGYGVATYKVLFPYMCGKEIAEQQPGREWARAHNSWLQMPFEVGIPGFLLFLGFIGFIVYKTKDPVKQAGLIIIGTNMMTAFPERLCQAVLILLMFLAYCSAKEEVLDYTYEIKE